MYKIIALLDRDGYFIDYIYIPILNNEPVIIIWRGMYFTRQVGNIYKESMTLFVQEGPSIVKEG